MAANQQLTQTDANAPCRKGLSHTCSDRQIDPTLGDAGRCTLRDALYCHPESYLAHAVCHRWGLGSPCYFARERIVEQMCHVQAPHSSGNQKKPKKRTWPARAEHRCELQANQYNQCSLSVVIFMCRRDASVSSFPQQQCHTL